ncbi:hypothetical protein DY926_00140 [Komagataeibacter melaceti]|uniref:Uncharacterized protein n=1 Tax=Komagataeibacter melaceti TaxID=2766577 RepID=A0A371Z532_9PROT|nr:hypothetical protein DY926_00140 [Komagataeibacter melaceti]
MDANLLLDDRGAATALPEAFTGTVACPTAACTMSAPAVAVPGVLAVAVVPGAGIDAVSFPCAAAATCACCEASRDFSALAPPWEAVDCAAVGIDWADGAACAPPAEAKVVMMALSAALADRIVPACAVPDVMVAALAVPAAAVADDPVELGACVVVTCTGMTVWASIRAGHPCMFWICWPASAAGSLED